MKNQLAKRASRISSIERIQNRRLDQRLMDLVNTVATDLENDHPTPHTGQDPPPGNQVDPSGSIADTTDLQSNGGLEARTAGSQLPAEVRRKPRGRLMKVNVWFTQDDAALIKKISTARGQRPEDFIQFATLNLLADLGAIGEERQRLLIMLRS